MARSKSKRANADEAREVRWAHSVRRWMESTTGRQTSALASSRRLRVCSDLPSQAADRQRGRGRLARVWSCGRLLSNAVREHQCFGAAVSTGIEQGKGAKHALCCCRLTPLLSL